MRPTRATRGTWLAGCAAVASAIACAVLASVFAAPAGAVTNLYAAQDSGTNPELSQYAVASDGSLTALAPAVLGAGAQDVAITPDGRFAYVTRSFGTDAGFISQFTRGAGGAMAPNGTIDGGQDPRGIVVNPQGTRVIYARGVGQSLSSRPINADGTLGAETVVPGTTGPSPRFLAMTPSGTSLYVGIAGLGFAPTFIRQYDVDPATGAINPKTAPTVAWPGSPVPGELARMSVSPDGRHLYATSGVIATGVARFDIGASGALTGGSLVAVPADGSATSVLPIAPGGLFAWAPTSITGTGGPPGQIFQFSRDAASGLLPPLFLPSVAYRPEADFPTLDAVANPDGASLYIGQNGNVGEWTITGGGALLPRASHLSAFGGVTNAGLVLAPSQAAGRVVHRRARGRGLPDVVRCQRVV